jgi:hypothetical protein
VLSHKGPAALCIAAFFRQLLAMEALSHHKDSVEDGIPAVLLRALEQRQMVDDKGEELVGRLDIAGAELLIRSHGS